PLAAALTARVRLTALDLTRPPHPRHLHSFPTRRSSDLEKANAPTVAADTIEPPTDAVEKAAFDVLSRHCARCHQAGRLEGRQKPDRKSTRLNSSHSQISYAVFCLKKKRQAYMPISAAPK